MYPLRIPGVEKVNLRRGCSQVSWAVTGPHLTALYTAPLPPCTITISFVPESIKIRSCRTNFKTGFFLSDYMWPPSTVWNSTHPQVHVHSLRLSPARLCSVGKISVWLISVQFSQKNKKTKNMKFWLFHSSLNFWSHFFRKICIFSTNFHFLPNPTQKKNSIFNCCTVHYPEKSGKIPTRQHPVIRTENYIFP